MIKVESPAPAIRSAPSRAASTARTSRPTTATSAASRSTPRSRPTARVFDELIASADVYIQNFRPGVAEQLGAGEERLRALNPRLVYCSISGFGASGPCADRPSYDTVAQAASGFLGCSSIPSNPRVVGPAIADALTGFYAAYGVLGALFERSRTGVGRTVEVSMLEAMAHFDLDAFAAFFALGSWADVQRRPRVSQSYVLRSADGGGSRCTCRRRRSSGRAWPARSRRRSSSSDARFRTRGAHRNYEALGA